MRRASFFDEAAKSRTTEAIRKLESVTAAEVVVAVRPRSSAYYGTSAALASACALAALFVMLLSPVVYDVRTIPIDVGLTFVVAFTFLHFIDIAKLRFTPKKRRRTKLESAARKAFDELSIDRTKDRTGLLVFVSLLERDVALIPDQGIRTELLGEDYAQAESAMRAALERRDLDAFLTALRLLGPALSVQLPRSADDMNELSDDVA